MITEKKITKKHIKKQRSDFEMSVVSRYKQKKFIKIKLVPNKHKNKTIYFF